MIRTGTKIKWKWGNGYATGKVVKVYNRPVTKKIKGSEITRNGTDENRAVLIEQEDGNQILKLESECEKAE
jgi:hypothetical protein